MAHSLTPLREAAKPEYKNKNIHVQIKRHWSCLVPPFFSFFFFATGDCHSVITLVTASKERISSFPGPDQCIQLVGKTTTGKTKLQNT